MKRILGKQWEEVGMKIDTKGYITLTPKESEEIMDLLDTLAAMSGAFDQDFTGDCKKAQKYSDKILSLKNEHYER